jgi:hypothetical protein
MHMPLYVPDEHKPRPIRVHVVELSCRDSDTHRMCIEEHAIAAGWEQPLGKYDRAKMFGDVRDSIISQASDMYDAQGKVELRDGSGAG